MIAEHFLNEGARVFLMDSGCPELARAFHSVQTGLTYVRGDISDLKELDRLLAEIEREEGKLDIVVANGVAAEYPTMREILGAPYETTMNLNLAGLLSAAERALPFVRDGGSIILNTASPLVGCREPTVFTSQQEPLSSLSRNSGQDNWRIDGFA